MKIATIATVSLFAVVALAMNTNKMSANTAIANAKKVKKKVELHEQNSWLGGMCTADINQYGHPSACDCPSYDPITGKCGK